MHLDRLGLYRPHRSPGPALGPGGALPVSEPVVTFPGMTTYHQLAAAAILDRILADPERARAFAEARANIRSARYFSGPELDQVGQIHRLHPDDWPTEQMAAFYEIFEGEMRGEIVRYHLDIGSGPCGDVARGENAARLAARPGSKTDAFDVCVDPTQKKADSDGTLTLLREVPSIRSSGLWFRTGSDPCPSQGRVWLVPMPVDLRPGTVPLEIGTTMPSRTWAHLMREGAVARWPYGHKELTIFVNLPRWSPRRRRVSQDTAPAEVS